jgi:hypothetical protein
MDTAGQGSWGVKLLDLAPKLRMRGFILPLPTGLRGVELARTPETFEPLIYFVVLFQETQDTWCNYVNNWGVGDK